MPGRFAFAPLILSVYQRPFFRLTPFFFMYSLMKSSSTSVMFTPLAAVAALKESCRLISTFIIHAFHLRFCHSAHLHLWAGCPRGEDIWL